MFRFTVEHLGFLAKVPGLPQVFDALLLATTALRRTPCLRVMEQVESHGRSLPGMRLAPHRLGGIGFVLKDLEIAHMHGNGLLDVRLDRSERDHWVRSGRVQPHHVVRESSWVSLWIENAEDLSTACALLDTAAVLRDGKPGGALIPRSETTPAMPTAVASTTSSPPTSKP
jgi:hypothetical protein